MMFALQNKDMQALWFDKRKSLNSIRPSAALGFILNVPSSSRMSSWLPSAIVSLKHWIAIRKIGTDELYFNLDSHLEEPQFIGNVRMPIIYNFVSLEYFLNLDEDLDPEIYKRDEWIIIQGKRGKFQGKIDKVLQ